MTNTNIFLLPTELSTKGNWKLVVRWLISIITPPWKRLICIISDCTLSGSNYRNTIDELYIPVVLLTAFDGGFNVLLGDIARSVKGASDG